MPVILFIEIYTDIQLDWRRERGTGGITRNKRNLKYNHDSSLKSAALGISSCCSLQVIPSARLYVFKPPPLPTSCFPIGDKRTKIQDI